MNGSGEHGPHSSRSPRRQVDLLRQWQPHRSAEKHGAGADGRLGRGSLLPRMWTAAATRATSMRPADTSPDVGPTAKRSSSSRSASATSSTSPSITTASSSPTTPTWSGTRARPGICPRNNHSHHGADFGWRSGAGRGPRNYAVSLNEVVDIGPGSPTGVTFGTGAKFPDKFRARSCRRRLAFGTLYAIHLTPHGRRIAARRPSSSRANRFAHRRRDQPRATARCISPSAAAARSRRSIA